MRAWNAFRGGFGDNPRRSSPTTPKSQVFPSKLPRDPASGEAYRALVVRLREQPDGTPVDESATAVIYSEIEARRVAAGMADGPPSPLVTGIRIRKANLPEWWEAGGSLILQSPDTAEIQVDLGLMGLPISNSLIIAGAHTAPPRFSLIGDGNLVVLGDRITMNASSMTVAHGSMVLVGDRTTATWMCFADVRNGGTFIAGADCMWATGINFMSDDTHAIRDATTGRRVNKRGGRIMLEEHVWVSDHVRIMGDTRVGAHGIVGATAFVKNVVLPPHTISGVRPARPARTGITWTRDDEP